jgi:hypothetical protein
MQSDSTGKEPAKSPLHSDSKRTKALGALTAIQFAARRIFSFFKSNGKLHLGSKWPVIQFYTF